jgi:16S rRNA (guanine(966)-N(2))-methyltransferase RsmD
MNLRIYGNRQLKSLPGQATRPTPARVREALFNIWQGEIVGCRFLDLCAGSGAIGAEALCRDAQRVVGIEQSSRACAVIEHNWRQVAQPNQEFRVIRGNLLHKLLTLAGQQFDLIYFDPPYASNLYLPVLEAIAQHQLLANEGSIAVEHDPTQWNSQNYPEVAVGSGGLTIDRQKTYGTTAITFYHRVE